MKKLLVVFLASFLAVGMLSLAGNSLFFYKGSYQAPPDALPGIEGVKAASRSTGFFQSESRQASGTLVVDMAHNNNFSPWEINSLLSRVVATGFTVQLIRNDRTSKTDEERAAKNLAELREKLRYADALAIISPYRAFVGPEISVVSDFVKKGGKLLLIDDPNRKPREYAYWRTEASPMNTIAGEFGILFENNYLYNLKENEGNYRNVSFKTFSNSDLTKGLGRVALYSAGSVRGGTGVIFTDDNTLASNTGAGGRLSPAATGWNGRVLAIHNLNFIIEPFNAYFDNDRLVANISDWVTTSERTYRLADFPYFMKESPAVAYVDATLAPEAIGLADYLNGQGKVARVLKYDEVGSTQDTIFMGLFKDANRVSRLLDGIATSPGDTLDLKTMGPIGQPGTAMVYLYREGRRHVLVVLADGGQKLAQVSDLLKNGNFRKWLVGDSMAIFQPGDFSIAPSTVSLNVTSGATTTFDVSITPFGGFADAVKLSAASTPDGLTMAPSPVNVSPPYKAARFNLTSSRAGIYTVTITGVGGDLTRTATMLVTVGAKPEPTRTPSTSAP